MSLNELSYSPRLIKRIFIGYKSQDFVDPIDITFTARNMIRRHIARLVGAKVKYYEQREVYERLCDNIDDEILDAVITEINLMRLDNML